MGGQWGTNNQEVWNTLTGLYADERAMVAQAYRALTQHSLFADIHGEFSDPLLPEWLVGKQLEKTLKLYHHGGLSLAERVFYATRGISNDQGDLRQALNELRQMTLEQIGAANAEYGLLADRIPTVTETAEGTPIYGDRAATLDDAFAAAALRHARIWQAAFGSGDTYPGLLNEQFTGSLDAIAVELRKIDPHFRFFRVSCGKKIR